MSNTMSDIFFTPYCNPFFVPFRKYESPTEIEPAHGHPLQIGIPYGDMLSISAHQRLYRHRILSKPVRASISVTCGDAPVPRKPVRASISVDDVSDHTPQPREGLHIGHDNVSATR